MLEIPKSAGLGVMDTENPQVPGKRPGGGKTLCGGGGELHPAYPEVPKETK